MRSKLQTLFATLGTVSAWLLSLLFWDNIVVLFDITESFEVKGAYLFALCLIAPPILSVQIASLFDKVSS